MSHKIFRSILLVAAAVLLASLLIIMSYLYEYFAGVQERQLGDELSLAAAGVENYGESYLQTVKPGDYRITWIAADGTVLYDTIRPDTPEENHAGREEVKRALETGEGKSTRYSTTLLEKTIYYARRLTDGSVLRMSISGATTGYLALGVVQPALLVFVLALILSSFLARRISNRIVEPLNHLDLDHPLDNAAAYAELSPLLRRIHEQRVENAAQLRALRKKTDEFNQTIGSMKEGLVLLDENERILSINAAAKDVFAVNGDCMGRDFLTIDRDPDMTHALGKARADGHAEIRRAHRGRMYQFDISRIESGGAPIGTVLLAFDITEREYAERNRREFTANVSHELKTPLQGIIGSAELIENGMVQPQDVPRFVEHIHSEASRMVTLIGDIIRLSQLDEGDVMPREDVDVLAAAKEAVLNLSDEAAKRGITMTVDGTPAIVHGVRRLISEIAFNLCENAVKYNRDGGSVFVKVETEGENAALTVQDTGIGIPDADQSRVFERFYRVDKSHSKASGGTGLGLSIVKHAVMYHHGKVELRSATGEGTCVRAVLPKNG
ncbi:MAG: ATP-binding protein [Clostridiales bacterium]|nr:ATP-binding protein [Clostridiales bacterium]